MDNSIIIAAISLIVGFTIKAISVGHNSGKKEARLDTAEKSINVLFRRIDELREHSVTHIVFKEAIDKIDNEVKMLRARSQDILEAIARLDTKIELLMQGRGK